MQSQLTAAEYTLEMNEQGNVYILDFIFLICNS